MKLPIEQSDIRRLVREFYAVVRQDEILQPTFSAIIGDDWEPHLIRMESFWASVAIGDSSFQGNVYGKHMQLKGIIPEHFERWLALFEQNADRIFPADVATNLKLMAHRIASSLQLVFFNEVIVP
jgi:hemoglobin